ncbi:MAG: efflux RND transporter periplasmic adaptor subunit [Labilithrix sp.]|nr:efflux RND transporter periplasmic adaptor subunit [Labilithrix sp.]MCW5813468.1 efflux RND transporter periplasmic adaptor subunit [Labilithrix sp.]
MAALSFFAVACKKPPQAEGEAQLTSATSEGTPIKVQSAPVVEKPMPEHLVLTGTLKASQESQVAADGAGKVTATFVERGQHVKQGETLALLDARGANLQVNTLNAQSALAQAQLEQAQRECDRVKALRDSGAISQAEYDRTTSQCQTTQWSVAAAQAQTKSAQKIVGDSVIRAPFAGIVGERFVNVGQYVAPQTPIVSLYTPDPLRLELTVPEANVGGLKQEQVVTFSVSAFEKDRFQGTVRYIAPNVRPQTRDLIIEALCPNADGKLKPGMFAVAQLETAEKPLPTVPLAALQKGPDATKAYVVVDKHVQERIVQTGSEKDGAVAILAGMKVGEQVILSPGADVRDGAKVQ